MPPSGNYLKIVRNQYEQYPFPHRNPQDELKMLYPTGADYLEKINHYCFSGKQAFGKGFRVLVAGGGTGDATMFLGEQLKNYPVHITHLDMSANSIEIAKARAKVRGLSNITFIHESILNLPNLGLEPFDYINCNGVLHHMADPDLGLKALASVLNPEGAMGLMVYGTYGRTGIYQMQQLMRLINQNETDMAVCVDNVKRLMPSLPPTNWLIRSGNINHSLEQIFSDDSNIYDTLLHSTDRSYTVLEVLDFVAKAGLHFVDFTGFNNDDLFAKILYQPESFIRDMGLRQKISGLPLHQQQAIAELILGNRSLHAFYVSKRPDTFAKLDDLNNVPYFFLQNPAIAASISKAIVEKPGAGLQIGHLFGTQINFTPQKYTHLIFRFLDGKKSLKEIFEEVRKETKSEVSNAELLNDFRPVYEAFFKFDALLLRDRSIAPYPPWTIS